MAGRLAIMVLSAALAASPALPQTRDLPDAEAEPLRPPQPVYPRAAAEAWMPGYCDVRFDVDTLGRPSNIRPLCSHPAFCESAAVAMQAVRFKPARRDGRIVPRKNVVYPLEYAIEGVPRVNLDLAALKDCVDPYIS